MNVIGLAAKVLAALVILNGTVVILLMMLNQGFRSFFLQIAGQNYFIAVIGLASILAGIVALADWLWKMEDQEQLT